jgi:hypothetical protein
VYEFWPEIVLSLSRFWDKFDSDAITSLARTFQKLGPLVQVIDTSSPNELEDVRLDQLDQRLSTFSSHRVIYTPVKTELALRFLTSQASNGTEGGRVNIGWYLLHAD